MTCACGAPLDDITLFKIMMATIVTVLVVVLLSKWALKRYVPSKTKR